MVLRNLVIPDATFAREPEHEPVMIRTIIKVAKFFASACGMMKITIVVNIAYIVRTHLHHHFI
jgi:diadenosine tetraphosphate (Ap4A) HIT family hydrolase